MRNEKGFTLIEIVMVIVLLGILAAVAIPRYLDLSGQAQNATARGVLGSLRSANAILMANNAAANTTATWNLTSIISSAQIQGVTVGAPAYPAGTVTIVVGNSTFTFTLAPTEPTIGTPGTIAANVGTW